MSASYKPEEIDLCASILDRACAHLTTHDQVTKELIGLRILHAAERGERDPQRLLGYALGEPVLGPVSANRSLSARWFQDP
jgi:hypothetical protein